MEGLAFLSRPSRSTLNFFKQDYSRGRLICLMISSARALNWGCSAARPAISRAFVLLSALA